MLVRCLMCLALLAPAAHAQTRAETEALFQTWLQTTIWPRAHADGVSKRTFNAAFSDVTLNWDLPDLVPPGTTPPQQRTQSQTEFRSPALYFRPNSVDGTANLGRSYANRFATTLAQTERATGVPAHIILAIWGRESGFGRVDIPYNTFRTLGTKGFMSARADYFTDELLAALRITQAGHIAPDQMRSSWAGAMGQPQFMPTSFEAHARDGDGDGRADIWRSEADTIRSIASYLATNGWDGRRDWGFEVNLPPSLPCTAAGRDQMRTIAEWEAVGVTRVSGRPFPAHERNGDAALLLPAGTNGPAFLVTPNFYVLKTYNNSDLYALFVGHVGDKIAFNVGPFRTPWQPVDDLLRSDIAAMQNRLIAIGYDVGGADGLVGFKTRRAIGQWQTAAGQTPTCFPNRETVRAITN
ncbi:lytic murein transglycosylase [Pseudooctadecabacter jejudonensis]|uniref:Membrane-bound lytic murein transglycosylase B n=1 Tax=Pseudooctadecabacter jejudonensis TaxID=1391910 RepID=A0A1Y5T911_9RHOB|nr:lytic murein transglycosylase [Pseudooctadecabacter jejudonensis]SLN54985.1 Membrane-bound lytic murein transglycosylase B precursor [Pseudooctadecabacter jejudonensis]